MEISNGKKCITPAIFFGVISIFIVVIGWIFISLNNTNCKVDTFQKDVLEIRTTLAGISVDIQWIKQKLNNK